MDFVLEMMECVFESAGVMLDIEKVVVGIGDDPLLPLEDIDTVGEVCTNGDDDLSKELVVSGIPSVDRDVLCVWILFITTET